MRMNDEDFKAMATYADQHGRFWKDRLTLRAIRNNPDYHGAHGFPASIFRAYDATKRARAAEAKAARAAPMDDGYDAMSGPALAKQIRIANRIKASLVAERGEYQQALRDVGAALGINCSPTIDPLEWRSIVINHLKGKP